MASDDPLVEQTIDAILEREAYRTVLTEALNLLYERHLEIERLSRELVRLREEFRNIRGEKNGEATAE